MKRFKKSKYIPDEILLHIFSYLSCGVNDRYEYNGLEWNTRFRRIMKYILFNYVMITNKSIVKYPREIINLMIEIKSLKILDDILFMDFYPHESNPFQFRWVLNKRCNRTIFCIDQIVKNSITISYHAGRYGVYNTVIITIKPMSERSKKLIKKLYYVKTCEDLERLYPQFDFQFEPIADK